MDVASTSRKSNENINRKPQGLLKSYHGIAYQIQWIMIVALQARRQGVDTGFTFRTEEDENDVGKFDDVVWQYQNGLEKKYNFLQCKHKLNLQEKITINELCKKADQDKNPFSLQKYFISYRDHIKTSPKYKDGLIENLIIATNINFEDTVKNNFKVVRNINPVLNVMKSIHQMQSYPRCWKIDTSCVKHDIINVLEQTYDLIELAKVLGEFIRNQLPFRLPNHLIMYSNAIYDNIVDPEENRLSDNFISGNNLSKQAEFLREAFFQEHFVKERTTLNLTHNYTISTPVEFAKMFAYLLKRYEDKNVVIHRKKSIIKQNIDKLAGFVLIIEDGIKFNYKFWTTCVDELPNESLKIFRTVLREELQKFGILNVDDSETAIAEKLDAYRFKITDFVTYRKEILDEVSFWDNASNYNGFKDMCSTKNLFKEERDLPNYSISDIINNIYNFFDLLVFAVGYSKECLSQVIQNDLKIDFGYINNEYIAVAFRAEIAKTLDQSLHNKFISTSGDVEKFFNTAKQQINRFILIGPTLEYRTRSFLHNIKFSNNSNCKIKLRPFIANKSIEQVLSVIAEHCKLSSMKVHQILESIPEYQFENQSNYIFMSLSTVFCLLDLVIQNFEFNCNLLVIECDTATTSDDEQYLFSEICRILSQSNNKRVVLIGKDNNSLGNLFEKNLGVKFKEVIDKRNNFLHLTKSSQDYLSSKIEAVFQGERIHFEALLVDNIKYLINCDVLYKVINSEKIEIGVPLSGLGKMKDYYINRTFCRRQALEKKVLKENDIFAVSNTNKFELSKEINELFNEVDKETCVKIKIREFNEEDPDMNNPIKFIILDNNLVSNQFNNLCQNYRRFNIHWLHKENERFIWQKTHGSLLKLHSYLQNDTKEYKEEDGEFTNVIVLKKVTIVSAEPGMGKSTVITNLELMMKFDPNFWIIRINLLHYSTDFKESVDEAFVIKFIYKAAKLQCLTNKKDPNPLDMSHLTVYIRDGKLQLGQQRRNLKSFERLEIGIFNHCYNNGKVVMLFDGYDEICSFYEKKVIKMINILSVTSVAHIFITTRPYNILKKLENNVREFSYTLKPFHYEEQKKFLQLYWKTNTNLTQINENHANVFIDELLQRFFEATNDVEKQFVSIPLQLRMLADNFQDEFEEFYDSNVQYLNEVHRTRIKSKLNLINLYDEFVNIKFEKIRFKEKNKGLTNGYTDTLRITKRERKKFIDDHQKLSIFALFHHKRKTIKKLLSQIEMKKIFKLIKLIENADDENGIINGIVNRIPIFVHQTFAEYFAARYLWKMFKTTQFPNFKKHFLDLIVNEIFIGKNKYVQICRFFYFAAEKDLKDLVSFVCKDDKIVALLDSIVDAITSIYHIYWENGSKSENGTDDIHQFENTNIYSNYVPCIKLLFKMIDCYISENELVNDTIAAIIKKDQTINLLRMSGEIGCINFAQYFVNSKQHNYKEDLLRNKWYFTPFWLAAKNQHLEVVRILSKIYDCNWNDKDRQSLSQRIYNNNESNILRSCLFLNIIDGTPYRDLNGYLRLPLVTALNNQYPVDVVKMLIKKSNISLINEFDKYDLSAPYEMSTNLLQYDSEITKLAVVSGINFSGTLNVFLFEFRAASLQYPILSITSPRFVKCSYYTDEEFLNLNTIIETLLVAGVGFNTKDRYDTTTIQYSTQIYYIHKLLNNIINIEQQLQTLLKLIIECVLSAKDTTIKFHNYCGDNCEIEISDDDYNLLVIPNRLYQLHRKMCSKTFKTISSQLFNLRLYLENAKKEINYFKIYPDSKIYNRIFTGYEEMLEYKFSKKNEYYQSLGDVEKFLLQRVLILYIRQDYDIKDAFKEVAAEVLREKVLSNWMITKKHPQDVITKDELLQVLHLNDINTNNKLRKLTSKIYDCGGIQMLHKTWSDLHEVGQKNISEELKALTKYFNVSTKTYKLLKPLKIAYETLITAIKNRDFNQITSLLQNVVYSRYEKAIVNAQDDEYGSPLHYAVYKSDLNLVKILLFHGANPNYKLEAHGCLLSHLESFDEDGDIIQEDYKSYTPLHLAVIKANTDIIQLLLSYGANCDIKNNEKKNSLQLAEERLHLDKEKHQVVMDILQSAPSFKTSHQPSNKEVIANTIVQSPSPKKRKRKAQDANTLQKKSRKQ